MKTTHFLSCLLVAAIWLGAAGNAGAAFSVNCGGATNVDTNPMTALGCSVGAAGILVDLNVALEINDLAANPYATDLQIILTHVASATSVAIYLGPGVFGPVSMMDAMFDDAAAATAPGSGNIIGTFLPNESLSAFNGLELSGDWTLEITDISAFPDEGIDLIGWRLTGIHTPEPSSLALVAFGLLGLAILSGRKPACP